MARRKVPQDGRAVAKAIEKRSDEETRAQAERRAYRAYASTEQWRQLAKAAFRELEYKEAQLSAWSALDESEIRVRPIKHLKKSGDLHSAAIPCTPATDWHIDERVKSHEVPGGKNRYSPDIAEERIYNYGKNFLKLVNASRSNSSIHQMVCFLAGDLFSGWIHEELMSSTDMSPIRAIEWLQPRVANLIEYWAKHGDFEKIRMLCVPGNHSRITRREMSVPANASLEHLLYLWLASHFKDRSQIEFQISSAKRTVTPIGGVRVRWMHGNDWNYGGGVGGVIIPMMNRTRTWDQQEHADFTVCGHWHVYYPSPRHLINGSLIGYTAYSSKYGPWEPPQQAYFLISEKYRRVVTQAPIFVE